MRPEALHSSTPTHWCVITGAPCSGKTTVLSVLERLGYSTTTEVAREVIETALNGGLTLAALRADEGRFQRSLIKAKAGVEARLAPEKLVFLDRGMPDSISYYRLAGLDPKEARSACDRFRYRTVLLFERLSLTDDGARTERDAEAAQLETWLEQDYRSLGYQPVRIPVATVADRVRRVLTTVGISCP